MGIVWGKQLTASHDPWANIEEVEPDEIDLQMLREIENDPDCHTIATEEEVRDTFGHI